MHIHIGREVKEQELVRATTCAASDDACLEFCKFKFLACEKTMMALLSFDTNKRD